MGQFAMDFTGFVVGKYSLLDMNGESLGRILAFTVVITYWVFKVFDIKTEDEGGILK